MYICRQINNMKQSKYNKGAGRKRLPAAEKKIVIRGFVKRKNAKRVKEELSKIINLVDGE